MKTVLDCLESGTSYLEGKGVESPRRNMEWLVAHQLECSRIELYASFDRPMSEEELLPLRELLKRRGQGEPLQHLLGTIEFFGREFTCDSRALVPRPETEELVEAVLKLGLPHSTRLLDMGTGSGVIGITLGLSLADRAPDIVLADISPEALSLARENAEKHGLKPTFLETDLLTNVEGQYHLITANLPYVSEDERVTLPREVAHDPDIALFGGADGLDAFRRFLPQVSTYLEPGGWLVLEIGANQGSEVTALALGSGLDSVLLANDLSGNPRFLFAQRAEDDEDATPSP